MILDKQLVLSDQQAITATAYSTNSIDLASAVDIARGKPIRFRAQVDTTFHDSSGSDATLTVEMVESDNADLSSHSSLWSSGALGDEVFVAGYIAADLVVPRTSKRYLGARYTVANGPFDAGKITTALVMDTETPMADRPSNYNTGF